MPSFFFDRNEGARPQSLNRQKFRGDRSGPDFMDPRFGGTVHLLTCLGRRPTLKGAILAQGTIKKLTDKGFGFIAANGDEIFFHMSAVENTTYEVLREVLGVDEETIALAAEAGALH